MTKIKVIQKKSTIGRPLRQKRTVKALGLKCINDIVIHNDTPEIRGAINKVKHIVDVEEIK